MNNFLNMQARLNYRGGAPQQERMILDKRKTLDRVVLYSYQGAVVKEISNEEKPSYRCLINPNKLKQDYDDKIISIGFESGFTTGTVFDWERTGTKWLIYLQDLTELAYFRGDIRRCRFSISWKEDDGKIYTTYAAIRGPVETKINFIQKNGISVDEPNHSLDILMPLNEHTVSYFKRYSKFYLKTLTEGDQEVCWRVEAKDSISMPGILEVVAVEYYSNKFEDDIEKGIAGGLIVEPIVPETLEITGPNFIKPKMTYEFEYIGTGEAEWSFDTSLPIVAIPDGKKISLKWDKSYTGQFILKYGEIEKTIVVESLY